MEDTLTIDPPPAVRIIAGMACLHTRNMVSTFTCITRAQVSSVSSTTVPLLPIPTLLSRQSSRPQRDTASSTMAAHCLDSVTSYEAATALPPSAAIIVAVRSASCRSRSTTSTLHPARASRMAAARPLPMPSPAAPPPVTIAAFPTRPHSSFGIIVCSFRCLGVSSLSSIHQRTVPGGAYPTHPSLGATTARIPLPHLTYPRITIEIVIMLTQMIRPDDQVERMARINV